MGAAERRTAFMPDPIAFEPEFAAAVAILRRLCRDPLPDLTPDTRLDELPGMDSLRVLHVIAMMEEQFGVEIDVAALDGIHQVQDILRGIRGRLDSRDLQKLPPVSPG
jgi:acyl carrier protein